MKPVNRRLFLRGLGGACVAAPFLSSLWERGVKAQAATPMPRAKRLIVMFTHFGHITNRFFPKRSHGALTAADLEPTTLKPLIPYVDKLLLPRGIRAMNEWTSAMTRGQGNDTYLQAVGSLFTCQPVTPNSDNPFDFDQAKKFNAKPLGPSLDHVIAQQLSPGAAPLFMRLANFAQSPATGISYSAAETAYAGLGQPAAILAQLTGLFSGDAPSPDTYQAVRGKSILDLVADDLATLERYDMSQADRDKLENWKSLLNDTVVTVTNPQCGQGLVDMLGLTEANFDATNDRPQGSDILTNKISDTLDGADLYSNLAVLAAVCNANPVIVLKYPASYVFSGLGITIESTSLANRVGSASSQGTCVPNVIDDLSSIDDYYAQKFAHLIGQLDTFAEGDGTVLDNTAAVWFTDVSDGLARNLNNLPIVQAGGGGGYFKTGWSVNVEDGASNLPVGNSEARCTDDTTDQIDGLSQITGTDAKLANAPINKYFCNLMNALGVKAGPDGFPLKGGSAEVTHYGMYDRTEDFVGGGTNPPTIHAPGEFSALRATS